MKPILWLTLTPILTTASILLPAQWGEAQTCASGDSSACTIERYQQQTQFNPNVNFRTPLQGSATRFNRIDTSCQQNSAAACSTITPQTESLRKNDTFIQLQETQQRRLESIFPNQPPLNQP
jgi:hypothetical protein